MPDDEHDREEEQENGSASTESETTQEEENVDRGDEIEQLRSEFRSELDSFRAEITGLVERVEQLQSELSSRGQYESARRDEGPRPKKLWWQPIIQEI